MRGGVDRFKKLRIGADRAATRPQETELCNSDTGDAGENDTIGLIQASLSDSKELGFSIEMERVRDLKLRPRPAVTTQTEIADAIDVTARTRRIAPSRNSAGRILDSHSGVNPHILDTILCQTLCSRHGSQKRID